MAQLPATVSDGLFFDLPSLLSAIILLVALFHSDTLIFTELLQRRDLFDIFASARQGPFCPFTFLCFRPFPETTFLERPRWRGAVMSFKKKKKKKRKKEKEKKEEKKSFRKFD